MVYFRDKIKEVHRKAHTDTSIDAFLGGPTNMVNFDKLRLNMFWTVSLQNLWEWIIYDKSNLELESQTIFVYQNSQKILKINLKNPSTVQFSSFIQSQSIETLGTLFWWRVTVNYTYLLKLYMCRPTAYKWGDQESLYCANTSLPY